MPARPRLTQPMVPGQRRCTWRRAKDTPVVKHALAPGRHVVEVRREGYRTAVDTIEVAAGGDVRRNLTLVREGGS